MTCAHDFDHRTIDCYSNFKEYFCPLCHADITAEYLEWKLRRDRMDAIDSLDPKTMMPKESHD